MDVERLDHFIILSLMDKLREKGVINTADIVEILEKAQLNFDEHKMEAVQQK